MTLNKKLKLKFLQIVSCLKIYVVLIHAPILYISMDNKSEPQPFKDLLQVKVPFPKKKFDFEHLTKVSLSRTPRSKETATKNSQNKFD
jgi:hypothetical protein